MRVTAISDVHGDRPKLKGGDLLIFAGDMTSRDKPSQYDDFLLWMEKQDYKKKVMIAGNHDNLFQTAASSFFKYIEKLGIDYLCDSGTEYEGYKIWGSPWTRWFHGVNPDCTAFMLRSEFDLVDKFEKIPYNTDILISHGPCYMRLDRTIYGDYAGCEALRRQVDYLRGNKLKYHFHGHIHEAYGEHEEGGLKTYNVARMDRSYRPVNRILNIEIEDKYVKREEKVDSRGD